MMTLLHSAMFFVNSGLNNPEISSRSKIANQCVSKLNDLEMCQIHRHQTLAIK